MLSAPVSGVATRNATVAPGVAPCLRSPSAVGRTPQEHKGSGRPRTEAQSTDFPLPIPTNLASSPRGTSTASPPATRKPERVNQRPRAADRHDLVLVDQVRPIDLLSLDQIDGELDIE